MEFFKDWGSIISCILSFINLIGGAVVYFCHNHKIKCQEKRLNELQIKYFSKIEEEEKKADFDCDINNCEENSKFARYFINFVNIGKVSAKNVRIEILNSEDELKHFVKYKWGPYNIIDPGHLKSEPIEIIYSHCYDAVTEGVTPSQLKIRITWDDDYDENRNKDLSPYFPVIIF